MPRDEARLETHVLRKVLRTEQLQQPEESVGIVLERRGAQEQDVAAEGRDRRDRTPAGLARVARRAAESLCFVHDEQIDSRSHRLVGQLWSLDQHFERDHDATVCVEGVEVGTEIAGHVGEALRIEEREHLVVLPPELTQPLHGERIRCDHETAIDLPGVHEAIQDERGLDGLAEAHFVGEQPPHGIAGARALRDVELMGKEPDASAEEGAQAVGFAKSQEVQDVQAGHEILDVIEIAKGEPLEERVLELQRPQRLGRRRAPVRQSQRPVRESRDDRRFLPSVSDPDRPARAQIDRDQCVRVRGEPERRSRTRKLDEERPSLEGRHASDPQLGIETVSEVVPDLPGGFRQTVCRTSGPRGSRTLDANLVLGRNYEAAAPRLDRLGREDRRDPSEQCGPSRVSEAD